MDVKLVIWFNDKLNYLRCCKTKTGKNIRIIMLSAILLTFHRAFQQPWSETNCLRYYTIRSFKLDRKLGQAASKAKHRDDFLRRLCAV